MGVRDWAVRKLSKTVETVAEPIKKSVIDAKDMAGNKAGLLANGLKVFVCLIIGWLLMKDDNNYKAVSSLPAAKENPNIIINNYIREKEND